MDEINEREGDFALPDLWQPSSFAHLQDQTGSQLIEKWDELNYRIDDDEVLMEKYDVSNFWKCLSSLSFTDTTSSDYRPWQTLEASESSCEDPSSDSIEDLTITALEAETVNDDPWSDVHLQIPIEKSRKFRSWELFYDKTFKEPRTTYWSEGGPLAIDAALCLPDHSTDGSPGKKEIQSLNFSSLLVGMSLLGLGRDSSLFQWRESEQSFRLRFDRGRIAGYTVGSFERYSRWLGARYDEWTDEYSIQKLFIGYGNKTRSINQFVDMVYSSREPCPTLVSLANSFATILTMLGVQIGELSRSKQSLLQLQSLFHGPGLILSCLHDIISSIRGGTCDEEYLSRVYSFIQKYEHTNTWLQPLMYEILARVSRPWLESVGEWLGLNKDLASRALGQCHNFVIERKEMRKREDGKELEEIQYEFLPNLMPNFISSDDIEVIFETGQGLRLLRAHAPEHPLANPDLIFSTEVCPLEWYFSWQDVGNIQCEATSYKSRVLDAIRNFHNPMPSPKPPPVRANTSKQFEWESSPSFEEAFNLQTVYPIADLDTPTLSAGETDCLSQIVMRSSSLGDEGEGTDNELFAPPLSLVPVLSFNPIIFTQAILVNQACLRLLFKEHNLRLHISLQQQYQLFGDGIFATRLSHALFDPELQSAKRHPGHARCGVSGLKLGSRESWPPASSELRLSLMGILNDSYFNGEQVKAVDSFRPELPGGLSFAIRDMPEEEFKDCMDPDSIKALDFLRLQYSPPSPIDAVITASCLERYDLIFKLLLRGTRMVFVVNQLSRDLTGRAPNFHRANNVVRRFTWEAHHFVSAVFSYFSDVVRSNWAIFSQKLDDIEKRLDDYDSGDCRGLHQLRDFHERVLDHMVFSLLLRQRQCQVMKLLEEIFGSILIFARYLRSEPTTEVDAKFLDVYHVFKNKLKAFMSVCRGLSERRGPGGLKKYELDHGHEEIDKEDMSEDRGNTLGQLLLRLEMSGYYKSGE